MRGFLFLFITLLGIEASANTNSFIPNYYRNRFELNSYSAIGWSDRHQAELDGRYQTQAQDTNGVRSSDVVQPSINAQGFYRMNNDVNLEAGATSLNATSTFPGFGENKLARNNLQLNGGYELTNRFGIPMAFSLSLNNIILDTTDTQHVTTTRRTRTVQFGTGYHLPSDIYLGVGYQNLQATNSPISHTYTIGAGKLWGDKKVPVADAEVFVELSNNGGVPVQAFEGKGLYNYNEFQFYADARYLARQRANRTETHQGTVGVDYEIAGFFVGPELTYFESSSNDKSSSREFAWSLEAGYRTGMMEASLRYGIDKSDQSFSATTFETRADTTTLSLIYKF